MTKLTFQTGVEEIDIMGKTSVFLNPTDLNLSCRIDKAMKGLQEMQDKYQARVAEMQKSGDYSQVYEYANEMDAEMRGVIDGVLQAPVCEPVFEGVSVFALAGGLPLWCNLLLALMDIIDDRFKKEQKETDPRIAKYLEKYRK